MRAQPGLSSGAAPRPAARASRPPGGAAARCAGSCPPHPAPCSQSSWGAGGGAGRAVRRVRGVTAEMCTAAAAARGHTRSAPPPGLAGPSPVDAVQLRVQQLEEASLGIRCCRCCRCRCPLGVCPGSSVCTGVAGCLLACLQLLQRLLQRLVLQELAAPLGGRIAVHSLQRFNKKINSELGWSVRRGGGPKRAAAAAARRAARAATSKCGRMGPAGCASHLDVGAVLDHH